MNELDTASINELSRTSTAINEFNGALWFLTGLLVALWVGGIVIKYTFRGN